MTVKPHLPDFLRQQRLRDLEDNIRKDLALLKEFEDELLYTTDPLLKARYKRDIQALQESADEYTRKYQELLPWTAQPASAESEGVAVQLKALTVQLAHVQAQLDDISRDISGLRKEVLARFDTSEQVIVSTIVAKLEETQLKTVNEVLMVIEDNRLIEQEAVQLIQPLCAALIALQQRNITLPGSAEVVEIINAPKIDAQHKLKVSIPIIPMVLTYEGEIGLGSGMDLEAAWESLKAKARSWLGRKTL